MKKIALLILILGVLFGGGGGIVEGAEYKTLILTRDLYERKATDRFDCQKIVKIYAYIEWENISRGDHILEGVWFNPSGKQQEYTRYKFTVDEKTQQSAWLWIELHPASGKFIDPFAGMGKFVGKWKVVLYLDGELLGKKIFYVLC